MGAKLDAGRRGRVIALIAAATGGRDQLAAERLAALAPGAVVTPSLAEYVERLLAIAVTRCAVCLEPAAGLHPGCATLHAEQLAAAIAAGAVVDGTIHHGARRRR